MHGQKSRILDVGSGPPVVVLHGWGGRIESMTPVVRCLESHFRVVALDLPGFGESPVPKGVWGTPDYAEYVCDVVRSLDLGRAHFVGHSYGAKTSMYLAATHKDAVAKLVLVGSSGLRSAPSAMVRAKRGVSKLARGVGAFGPTGEKVRRAINARIASQDYQEAGAMRPILVRVVQEDLGHLMPEIEASTLLIWGTEDDAVPVALARRMEALIPDAGLVLFEGAGHFAYLDEQQRFCQVLRHFFDAPGAR